MPIRNPLEVPIEVQNEWGIAQVRSRIAESNGNIETLQSQLRKVNKSLTSLIEQIGGAADDGATVSVPPDPYWKIEQLDSVIGDRLPVDSDFTGTGDGKLTWYCPSAFGGLSGLHIASSASLATWPPQIYKICMNVHNSGSTIDVPFAYGCTAFTTGSHGIWIGVRVNGALITSGNQAAGAEPILGRGIGTFQLPGGTSSVGLYVTYPLVASMSNIILSFQMAPIDGKVITFVAP